jgi:hypothetical protein
LFSFGVKAGTPLTTPYTTEFVPDGGASASELRFTVGPTIELHLPFHLSVEADALWRQSSFSGLASSVFSGTAVHEAAHTGLLLKLH